MKRRHLVAAVAILICAVNPCCSRRSTPKASTRDVIGKWELKEANPKVTVTLTFAPDLTFTETIADAKGLVMETAGTWRIDGEFVCMTRTFYWDLVTSSWKTDDIAWEMRLSDTIPGSPRLFGSVWRDPDLYKELQKK